MELILSMDRMDCIAREFIRLQETGQFSSAKLTITETELKITPLAEQIKIVLSNA